MDRDMKEKMEQKQNEEKGSEKRPIETLVMPIPISLKLKEPVCNDCGVRLTERFSGYWMCKNCQTFTNNVSFKEKNLWNNVLV